MNRTEIAEELRAVRNQPCFSNLRYVSQELLDAALSLIEPQPITEAALREAGFNEGQVLRICNPDNNITTAIHFDIDCDEFYMQMDACGTMLHITDMQTLTAVIAALGGTTE